MTLKDRTNEFVAFAQEIHTKKSQQSSPGNLLKKLDFGSKKSSQRSPFHVESIEIVKTLGQSKSKIDSFSKLLSRSNLFNDSTAEIDDLSVLITSSFHKIKENIQSLPRNHKASYSKSNQQTVQHHDNVISSLSQRLVDLTQDFSASLQQRSQKTIQNQKKIDSLTGAPSSPLSPAMQPQALRQRKRLDGLDSGMVAEQPTYGAQNPVSIPMPYVSSKQQQVLHYEEKSRALQTVESTIHELQGIFSQLASLVSQQGEMLDRVDSNLSGSLANVTDAQSYIMKYHNAIRGNRSFMIKMFFVLIFVIVLFMVMYR